MPLLVTPVVLGLAASALFWPPRFLMLFHKQAGVSFVPVLWELLS